MFCVNDSPAAAYPESENILPHVMILLHLILVLVYLKFNSFYKNVVITITSALPMGFAPWLSCVQTDYHLIVWWSSYGAHGHINGRGVERQTNPMQTQIIVRLDPHSDSHTHKLMISSMIIGLWHAFTKMAISPLIMVRFSKFKICHAQDFGADLSDVTITSRAMRRARWRHARAREWRHIWRHPSNYLSPGNQNDGGVIIFIQAVQKHRI